MLYSADGVTWALLSPAADGDQLELVAGVPDWVTPAAGVPTGVMLDWTGDVTDVPAGWILGDGSAIPRGGANAALFALYNAAGLPYGNGDGVTTFNLPDTRGRVTVGLGTNTDVDVLGESEGSALGSRRPRHLHTVVQPSISRPAINVVQPTISRPAVTVTDPGHTHAAATNRFGGSGNTTTSYPGVNLASTDLGTTGGALVSTATGVTAALAADPVASGGSAALAGDPVASGGTVGPQTNAPTDGPAYLVTYKIVKL